MSTDWMVEGLCAETDPDLFTPDDSMESRKAREICGRCDVKQTCLEYALATEQTYGIWGGHTARELRAMRRAAA